MARLTSAHTGELMNLIEFVKLWERKSKVSLSDKKLKSGGAAAETQEGASDTSNSNTPGELVYPSDEDVMGDHFDIERNTLMDNLEQMSFPVEWKRL